MLEYDGTTGAVQRWYAYGAGSNDVLRQMNVAAGTRTTLIPDIQGSIRDAASNAAAPVKAGYLPYGENSATTTGTFRYTGSRIDPEAVAASQPSGLTYMRARSYSARSSFHLRLAASSSSCSGMAFSVSSIAGPAGLHLRQGL